MQLPDYILDLPNSVLRAISDRGDSGYRGTDGLPSDTAYPNDVWSQQQTKYAGYGKHFEGDWLNEKVGDTDVERYPLHFNVYRLPVMLHASFLFGEAPDSSDPLVKPIVEVEGYSTTDDSQGQNTRKPSQRSIDAGKRMTDFLNRVWYQNEGRAKQMEAGIVSQIYGGCIFGSAFDRSRPEYLEPYRIDHLLPEYFFPVWSPNNYFDLVEAFIAYRISKIQAKALYGVNVEDDRVLYHEHWARDHYEITVGDQVIDYKGLKLQGAPLGGFVPYTYVPHPPRVGSFYGESLLEDKLGLAREINHRLSDLGDIVAGEARNIPAISNAQKVTIKKVSGRLYVLDLGTTLPGKDKPEINFPGRNVGSSASSVSYVMDLINMARSEAYTPPIVYGLDEGSQRSALTLALRMIPFAAHIRQERTYFESGLARLERQLLTYAALKEYPGIEMEFIRRARIHHEWAPMLPRDAEQEINQLMLRLQANTLSPQTVMEKLGDVQDIQQEMNLIRQWLEYLAKVEGSADNDPPKGGAMGENAAKSKDSSAQAARSELDQNPASS